MMEKISQFGAADQSVVHHAQTGFESGEHPEVIRAQNLQASDVLRVDLV